MSEANKIPAKRSITSSELKALLPKGSSVKLTDSIMEDIKNIEAVTGLDQDLAEEKILSHMHLLGSIKKSNMEHLINAVKYCSLNSNYTNEESWSIVFPERAERKRREGKLISSSVCMYNQTDMVVAVQKAMVLPDYLFYQKYHHESIKKQYDLMNGIGARGTVASPHVQHLAAKEMYELTKMPEENSLVLKVGMDDETKSIQKGFMEQLRKNTLMQKARMDKGASIEDVQRIGLSSDKIIEAEVE